MKNQRDELIIKKIQANLRELRKKKGATQGDLAIITGRSENAIGSWEQGLSLPDIETLYRLSIYYQISMEYFFQHEPEELKKTS